MIQDTPAKSSTRPLSTLSTDRQAAIKAERGWLREFIPWAKGDPKLAAADEELLNALQRDVVNGARWANRTQVGRVLQLAEMLGYAENRPPVAPATSELVAPDAPEDDC